MRRLADELLEYASRGEVPPPAVQERAAHERARKMRARSERSRRSRGRRKDEAAEKAERRQRIGDIRQDVMIREGGCCACCGWDASNNCGEIHHIVSGVGRRRQKEDVLTCVLLCRQCHRFVTGGDESTLRVLATYCIRHSMPEAARAISHRLARIEDARAPARRSAP